MAVVRLVSDVLPHAQAYPVDPTLEDVYLYLFNEQSGDAPKEKEVCRG